MAREAYKALGYKWKDYERDLKAVRADLEHFSYSAFIESDNVAGVPPSWGPKPSSLSTRLFLLPRDLELIPLSTLLQPIDVPQLPNVPEQPALSVSKSAYPDWYFTPLGDKFFAGKSHYEYEAQQRQTIVDSSVKLQQLIEEKRQQFEQMRSAAAKEYEDIKRGVVNGDVGAIQKIILIAHQRHSLPKFLRGEYWVAIDLDSQVALVQFKFPDYSDAKFVIGYSGRRADKPKYATPIQAKKYVKLCLYSLIIRSAYLAASFSVRDKVKSIAVNVEQDWHDTATGQPRSGMIASVQAPAEYLRSLDLSKLDPEACFRHLKGIATPSLQNVSAIRPIFVLNKNDERFVASQQVDGQLEPEANLAAIPWEDFEHLVAQLFEWEFQQKGIEVRVTRASRDRGVDAVLFDPDPLRGGKYVLQAKRYTRTVDVAAVRDLYGTLMNEGANRGILITTSTYGPDAYEFAKDKPISLVDGPNLILMLQRHGKKYRIDLEEARRLNIE